MRWFKFVFIFILLATVLQTPAFALDALSKCNTQVIIDWMKRAGKGKSDIGVHCPDGEGTVGPDDTNEPRVLVVDSKGNIYVADPVNYRVLKFNQKGSLVQKIKLQQPTRMTSPYGNDIRDMTVDKMDNLYLINYYQCRVEIYSPDGKFLRIIDYSKDHLGEKFVERAGSIYQPDNIQVDYDGNIYIHRDLLWPEHATGGIYSKEGVLLKRLTKKGISPDVYKIHEKIVNEKIFDKKMVDYSGYYLTNENYDDRQLQQRILTLNDKDGKIIHKCGPVDIELTTRIYVDRKGSVYYFDSDSAMNIVKVKMLER